MKLWPLALALVCVGCQPPAEKPVMEAPPEPTEGQKSVQNLNPPKETPDPDYIPERLRQLKDHAKDTVVINGHKIEVFLALNDSTRAEGLMHVLEKHLKNDQGMIFAFWDEKPRQFWMQNTKIDLDLAYISTKGKIQSIHHMIALNEKPVPGKGPAMYVLEMKHGAFKRLGIKEGMIAKIPPAVKSEDSAD